MKYTLAVAAVLGLLGGMLASANANNRGVELALESQNDTLSIFHRALINTGVAGELNENTEYTVFAPTNAAFSEIQPRIYPCFYSAQCRKEVAAILRNHIVPRRETIKYWSTWGGPVSTIGPRGIRMEEAYKDVYTVDGHRVLFYSEWGQANVYTINGVIADDQELALFHRCPGTDMHKKGTVHRRRSGASYGGHHRYCVPGGYPAVDTNIDSGEYVMDDEMPNSTTQTTTVTRTGTTQ
jgi:uncharacterized surface protein with fasciclin (FAS1) repeats